MCARKEKNKADDGLTVIRRGILVRPTVWHRDSGCVESATPSASHCPLPFLSIDASLGTLDESFVDPLMPAGTRDGTEKCSLPHVAIATFPVLRGVLSNPGARRAELSPPPPSGAKPAKLNAGYVLETPSRLLRSN